MKPKTCLRTSSHGSEVTSRNGTRHCQKESELWQDNSECLGHVLARIESRRSFRPKPAPEREITLSRACPFIGPALSPSSPPSRGMGPTAGDAAAVIGFAATPAEGASPPGVSRAVDWPFAPWTSVAVLLSVSRGAVCGHRACVGVSRRPVMRQHGFHDQPMPRIVSRKHLDIAAAYHNFRLYGIQMRALAESLSIQLHADGHMS